LPSGTNAQIKKFPATESYMRH